MVRPAISTSAMSRRGLLIATATCMVAACKSDEDGIPGSSTATGSTVLIGVSLELTGAGAALGVLQERALRITLESLNEEGVPVGHQRRPVQLLIRDNASDPKIAREQAVEFAERDMVNAIIGGTLAETSHAILAVAQKQQVPFISCAFSEHIVLPLSQRTFIYKLTPDAGDVARRLARLIREQNLRDVALLAADGAHGDAGVRAITRELKTAERELIKVVRLPRGDVNFASAARRAASGSPGAMVIWATAPDSGTAARALRETGFRGRFFFDAGAVAEDTLSTENRAAVEGAYVVHPMSLSGSSLTNTTSAGLARRGFVFRYIQQNGSFSGFAPYASDAVQLVVNAARLANSVDRGRLRAYLETQITEGIAGAYSFGPIRHGGMEADSLGIFTISRGSWSRVS